jgi:CBS domain-containing protein
VGEQVSDMTKRVAELKFDAHMAEAKAIERLLRESTTCDAINQLPVVARDRKTLLGIVTDRDLRDAKPENGTVESVMTRPAITLARQSTLINACEVMRLSRIGSVPIADGEKLAGIITRSDILEAFVAFSQGHYRRTLTRLGRKVATPRSAGLVSTR